METLIILVVAAGRSAAVGWWALSPPAVRDQRRTERARPAARQPASSVEDTGDGFVLLPGEVRVAGDERPNPALALLRLVVTIAFVSLVVVAIVALIGLLLKVELDQYFTSGS